MRYLKFKIQAPLMHFTPNNGDIYKNGSNRQTSISPTRRTIVGMLGCALGLPVEKLEDLSNSISELRYKTIKEGNLLTDFQTHGIPGSKRIYNNSKNPAYKEIGSGASREIRFNYSSKSSNITFEPYTFTRIDGTRAYEANVVAKQIGYVSDAEFDIYVKADDDVLERIEKAIMNPYWVPYVGMARCIPNVFKVIAIDDKEIIDEYHVCL